MIVIKWSYRLLQMFFTIKYKNSVVEGARLLFEEIEFVRQHCTIEEQKVAFHSIQNNAWFAHPENIGLSMCGASFMITNLTDHIHLLY